MKSAFLIAMCVSFAAAAKDPMTNPVFYADDKCTGTADPAAAKWSYVAKDKIKVTPFSAAAGAEFDGYTLNTCMTDSSVKYSVMVTIDSTACPTNGEDVLQLSYWKDSTTCEKKATTVTTLTQDTCVKTPVGSAKFAPALNTEELCASMNFRAALQTGGMRVRVWAGEKCDAGQAIANTVTTMGQRACGAVPECDGCCKTYNPATCSSLASPNYLFALTACNKVRDTWEGALAPFAYSDDKCTVQDNSNPTTGVAQHFGSCISFSRNDVTASTLVDFVAPLTIDIYCEYVQVNANHSVDGFVNWEEFNRRVNAAPAAHPVTALMFMLLAAVMLF